MPSINDLSGGKKKPSGARKAKAAESKPSMGDRKSKIRSKQHGLAPGFDGIVKSGGAVMHIKVDAKGREKVISTYIPDSGA